MQPLHVVALHAYRQSFDFFQPNPTDLARSIHNHGKCGHVEEIAGG